MIVSKLIEAIQQYSDYSIESDSGWECNPTDIDAAFINHDQKLIVLCQGVYDDDESPCRGEIIGSSREYTKIAGFELLYK